MSSTGSSEVLLRAENLRVIYEVEHYHHRGLRDLFVSAVTNPIDYFFRRPELLAIIDGVSFELRRGTRLGIIGVNGCGKTTLCRTLAGMVHPQEGQISRGASVRAIFDTGTGVVPELTGLENARLLARLFFPERRDVSDVVAEAIEFSELGHFQDVPFNQYSKGMQARLLLSLISAVPCDVLILDEVFDGADVFFQQKIAERMLRFIHEAGATVFVSHSLAQLRQVCNEVIVLDQGKIFFKGDVEQGWQEYLRLHEARKPSGALTS
jgi:ABC-type polysaccharide/polyol phosphate transport system ATPase subunit